MFAHLRLRRAGQGRRTRARPARRRPRGRGAARAAGCRLEAIEVVVSVDHGRDPFVDGARRACGPRCCSVSRCRRSSACRRIPTGRRRCAAAASTTSTRSRSTRGRRARSARRTRTGAASVGASRTSRESPSDNGYAQPDRGRHRVLRPGRGRGARGRRPRRRADARPSAVATCPPMSDRARRPQAARDRPARRPELPRRRQPRAAGSGGRSASASIRYEGWCCHTVGYQDGDRVRPVLHRASISEMVVPYGDPGAMHGWKNAFDAGEWGLGRMANSLKLGCDCLGDIHYFDARARDRAGRARTPSSTRSACTRRTTGSSGSTSTCAAARRGPPVPAPRRELRRHRRQLRVRLLLVLLPRRQHPARGEAHRDRLDHGDHARRAARVRQRDRARARGAAPPAPVLAPASTSTSTDRELASTRSRPKPVPAGPDNPWGNAFAPEVDARSTPSSAAQRDTERGDEPRVEGREPDEPQRGSANRSATSSCPRCRRPRCSRRPESSVGRRAGFARHNLWVTPYRARRAPRRR